MKKLIASVAVLSLLGACAQPLVEYEPVVDRPSPAYTTDLAECRALAVQAEAKYQKEQNNQLVGQMIVGALLGAAIGASIGDSSYAAAGAGYGAAAGAAETDFEQAHGGPRRIVDRCLATRGHRVISDLGRG